MGKRKTGAIPVNVPKKEKKMVIDMTRVELAKSYQQPGFRTGRHMTEKDRPRKKNWKKDYYDKPDSSSFIYKSVVIPYALPKILGNAFGSFNAVACLFTFGAF